MPDMILDPLFAPEPEFFAPPGDRRTCRERRCTMSDFLGVVSFIGLALFGGALMRVLLHLGDALKAYTASTKRKQP